MRKQKGSLQLTWVEEGGWKELVEEVYLATEKLEKSLHWGQGRTVQERKEVLILPPPKAESPLEGVLTANKGFLADQAESKIRDWKTTTTTTDAST